MILKNKDSNNAVCVHFAWSIQTEFTPPGKCQFKGRSLILSIGMTQKCKIWLILSATTPTKTMAILQCFGDAQNKRLKWRSLCVLQLSVQTGYTPQGERQPTCRSFILSNSIHVVTDLYFYIPTVTFTKTYSRLIWSSKTSYLFRPVTFKYLLHDEYHDCICIFFNAFLWWITHWKHLHMILYFISW